MQSVHILKLIMKVRKSVANTNKNSLLMFSEKLPREVDELPSSFRQNHLKRKSFISEFSIDRIHSLHKPVAIVWTKLFTGSSYFGRWNQFGFNGHGIYRFPDGLTYDGELKDGHFHGDGTLTFPDGNEIIGSWEKGVNQYMSLRFLDRLMFKEKDWDYCMSPDRRYAMDEFEELPPIGRHSVYPNHSNAENGPTGYYYTGEGYYDPETKCLYKLKKPWQVLRIPTDDEVNWILKNCALLGKTLSTVQKELLENVDYGR